jgi:uncharacterized protein (TIGR02246 family)
MDDEQAIRQLITTWMEATKAGDLETVLSLMAEDVVFLVQGQPPMVGRDAFAATSRAQEANGRPQFEGTSEVQEIRVMGDWAYLWTKLRVVVKLPGGGGTKTRSGHTLSILQKVDGRWVLARDANLLAPEPTGP